MTLGFPGASEGVNLIGLSTAFISCGKGGGPLLGPLKKPGNTLTRISKS